MNKFFTLILWVTCLALNAQKIELDQVTIEELSQTQHPLFPDAEAAVMFEKGEVRISYYASEGFVLETEIICKIKIYKKEGFKYATITNGYFSDAGRENLYYSKAVTYNLVNGKIEKTKLKSDGEFIEKLTNSYNLKKITFPNVKEGCIVEYKMNFRSTSFDRIKDWEFQKEIPVDYSSLKTNLPDYIKYSINVRGYYTPAITKLSKEERFNNGGSNSLEIPYTIKTYSLQNIEPLKDEGFIHNIKNYTSILEHELSSIQYPNSPYKDFTNTWDGVASFVNSSENFGSELKLKNYYEDEISDVLLGATNQTDKMIRTFEWLKERVKWNGRYGIFCNDGVKKAFKNNTGNVAEINLMLTSMLRNQGIDAHPILVSSRENGISFFPSTNAYNYVIVGVTIDGKFYLLDATNSFSVPNIIPLRARNWTGRMIFENGTSKQIDLDIDQVSKFQKLIKFKVTEEGIVNGVYKGQFTDYASLVERSKFAKNTLESNIELLEKKYSGIEIGQLEFQNLNDCYQNFSMQFEFKSNKYYEKMGDKIYISPLLFFTNIENPFTKEDRKYPINFSFPYTDAYVINIELPEGYSVEYLPKSEHVKMNDDIITFKYLISHKENTIQLMLQENFHTNIIPTEIYPDFKNIMKMIIDKENEKIVLRKI